MIPTVTPLTADDVRLIIRTFPGVFAAIGGAPSSDQVEVAGAVTQIIMANPAVINLVVALGLATSLDHAERLGLLFKYVAAAGVLQATAAAHDPHALAHVIYEELSPLCFGSEAVQ